MFFVVHVGCRFSSDFLIEANCEQEAVEAVKAMDVLPEIGDRRWTFSSDDYDVIEIIEDKGV